SAWLTHCADSRATDILLSLSPTSLTDSVLSVWTLFRDCVLRRILFTSISASHNLPFTYNTLHPPQHTYRRAHTHTQITTLLCAHTHTHSDRETYTCKHYICFRNYKTYIQTLRLLQELQNIYTNITSASGTTKHIYKH